MLKPFLELNFQYSRIVDDHFEHILRLFKDKVSGGIRLQASVYTGEMKKWEILLPYFHMLADCLKNTCLDSFHHLPNPLSCVDEIPEL